MMVLQRKQLLLKRRDGRNRSRSYFSLITLAAVMMCTHPLLQVHMVAAEEEGQKATTAGAPADSMMGARQRHRTRDRTRDYDFNISMGQLPYLELAPEDSKFIVTQVGGGDEKDYNSLLSAWKKVEVGDQIIAVEGEPLTSVTLAQALQHTEGTFVMPIVSAAGRSRSHIATDSGLPAHDGHKLLRFMRIEIFEAEEITIRPLLAARQAEIRRHTRELQQEKAVNHRLEESQKQALLLRQREDEEFTKAQKRRKHEEEEAKHAARQARLKEEQIQREKKAESEEKFIAENKAKARARERAEEERRINKAKADARLEAQEKLREKVMQREAQEKRQVEVQKAAANEEAKKFKQREAERQAQADEIARADAAHAEEVQKGIEREKAKIFKEIQDAAERRKLEMKTMEESKKEEEARKLRSQKDPYTYITASFRKKGPLGLLFVPGAIPMVLSSSSGELKKGDELCSVNDEDVLEADSLNDIAEIIAEAPYPKMLKFRRLKPVKKVETLDADGKKETMVVVKPGILSGYKIEYQLAKFGAKKATSCRAREIVFAVPFDLCSSPRLGLTSSISDAILLSTRGGCMFSVKADNIEELNPHALAVINTDEKLMAMPFPKNKEPKFPGPSLLMKKSDGDFIRLVHGILNADETKKTKTHVRAQLGNSCGALVGDEKYRRKWGGSGEGRLLIHSGKREEEFEIVKAAFGTPIDNKPFRAIIADPISGCDEKGFKQNVKNAFVIVERGNCPFIEKAKIVTTAGGSGLIVINTNKKMIKMPAGPSGSPKVKIPAIMIPSGSLAKLKSLRNEAETKAAKGSFIGRLVFKEE